VIGPFTIKVKLNRNGRGLENAVPASIVAAKKHDPSDSSKGEIKPE
jgi:hypothetical protein